jgi:D-glycerate 3-kinase
VSDSGSLLDFQQLSDILAHAAIAAGHKVVAISGAQGCGKTTLATLLAEALVAKGQRCAVVSLDDYYLGRTARQQLAREIHPLLKTRGVPGTHQIDRLLADLRAQHAGLPVTRPRFCKATDDCLADRPACQVDVLILEGWCIGLLPLTESQLLAQPNVLEQQADADAGWRYWVNQQLSGTYQQVWAHCDALYLLQAPDWLQVCRWRAQAEQQLWAASGSGMDPATLALFMQHYQRWTMQLLAGHHVALTAKYYLNETHQIYHQH